MGTLTHEVTNQPPRLAGHDALTSDRVLSEALDRHVTSPEAHKRLHELGELAGTAVALDWGEQANSSPPTLRTHDRFGHRIDEVDFHPAWHQLMRVAVESGLHAAPWLDPSPDAHAARAVGFLLWSQVEAGHGCPISMTYAAVPALRTDPELAAVWLPRLAAPDYDPGLRAPAEKAGVLAGMGMTEKQGGSDVRTNTTIAVSSGADGDYALTGHKWFCSAPMNDLFLVLAQAPGGLTTFVVPRVLDDGTRNVFRIQRLKDKLGNRSNASAEIELDGTWARRLGEEGRGVRTIIEMVAATRLDCVLGSAALMRRAVAEATWHTAHRQAFGRPLREQPLMRNVLADLALDSEAATVLGVRLAAAVDASERDDPGEQALRRLALPLAKFWVCKRGLTVTGEALECLGGNGYVEESSMPRLYREAPVNSVWEGSGNVNALDVLRALRTHPASLDAWLTEVGLARGADRHLDAALADVLAMLADLGDAGVAAEVSARRLAERMALVMQASLLVRFSTPEVADAFCAGRLGPDGGLVPGTLPRGLDLEAIMARATPETETG